MASTIRSQRLMECSRSAITLLLLMSGMSAFGQPPAWQSLHSISAAATEHIRARLGKTHESTIESVNLDRRVRVPRCSGPLEAFLTNPSAAIKRNTTVGVRCRAPTPWKLFVPVTVATYRDIIVAAKPIAAGASISPEDIKYVRRDVAALGSNYIAALDAIKELAPRRHIDEGAALTLDMFRQPILVQRGQQVTLVSGNGGIRVTSSGTALQQGGRTQRIRVQNTASRTIVEGLVRDANTVEVRY